jgi:two-component system nitrogen regulation response regulator GlnG
VRLSGDLALRDIVRTSTVHVERVAIAHALRKTGGNKSKAARLLQVDYKTLHSKVKEYGIQIEGEQLHDQETQ